MTSTRSAARSAAPRGDRPLRADARRNRERIMTAAATQFAEHGHGAQMDQIAVAAGVGTGTLYRHYPSKRALLTAMVRLRVEGMAELARAAEEIDDPREAFDEVCRRYLEAADGDACYQLALMGSTDVEWPDVEREKAQLAAIVGRIIARGVAAGRLRQDLGVEDFYEITGGVISSMYFTRGGRADWRRHLDLALHGIGPGR